jgi:hypothetical protein
VERQVSGMMVRGGDGGGFGIVVAVVCSLRVLSLRVCGC